MNYDALLSWMMANPALVWPMMTAVVSFAFRWMSSHSSGAAKMMSAVSVDLPMFWEGLMECFGKAPKLP